MGQETLLRDFRPGEVSSKTVVRAGSSLEWETTAMPPCVPAAERNGHTTVGPNEHAAWGGVEAADENSLRRHRTSKSKEETNHTLETLSAAVQNAQLTQTELDELVRLLRQQVPAAVTPQLPARKKANDFDTVELAALEFVMDSGEVEKISMRGGRAKCTYSVRCSNISDLRRIPCTVFETDRAGATGPFAGVYFASVRQVGDQYRPHWR